MAIMHHTHPYRRLALMTALSFTAMYILMYAMVDVFANVIPNLNQFFMAGLMTTAMVLIELGVMGTMYPRKSLNGILVGVSIVFFIFFWVGIRSQIAITDREFLKSMIPHHAGAILMCEKATLSNPAIQELCENIVLNQEAEIEFMKGMLSEEK